MHILLIPSWYPATENDPTGVFIRNYARMYINKGCRAGILSYRADMRVKKTANTAAWKKTQFSNEVGIPVARHHRRALPKTNKFLLDLWLWNTEKIILDYIERHGIPHIIHAHSFPALFLADHLYKAFHIPFLYTEHSTAFLRSAIPKRLLRSIIESSHNAIFRVAVSSELSNAMQKAGLTDIVTIPNPVDTLRFTLSKKPASHYLVSAGYKVYEKGIDILAKAMQNNRLASNMIITDTSPETEKLFRGQNVLLRPMLTNIEFAHLLQNCRFFISSSRYETFGMMIFEALSCGKPIVSTRTSGVVDLIPEDCGIFIEKENPTSLREAILNMEKNYGNFDPLDLRNRIKDKVSFETVGIQYLKLIENVQL